MLMANGSWFFKAFKLIFLSSLDNCFLLLLEPELLLVEETEEEVDLVLLEMLPILKLWPMLPTLICCSLLPLAVLRWLIFTPSELHRSLFILLRSILVELQVTDVRVVVFAVVANDETLSFVCCKLSDVVKLFCEGLFILLKTI
jgi:hypothetical protein